MQSLRSGSRPAVHSLRAGVFALRSLVTLIVISVASCAPRGSPVSIPTIVVSTPSAPTATVPVPHAPDIRFALIGDVSDANVWAMFDSKGYSYNNYAIRSDYYPKLYGLSIPDGHFEARAASGMPSAIQPDGVFFAASVPLRSDLTWSDGSPFTAEDVAFTVNTALSFQLGFDWRSAYDPEWLDHVRATDAHTVKFYFKRAPSVDLWQYGALQGPVVQQKYWSPKLAQAEALLPPANSAANIDLLQSKVEEIQKQVDAIIADGATATGEEAHKLQGSLLRRQGDLDEARNNLSKAQASFEAALEAARQSLYTVDSANETTLGNWMPAGRENDTWVNTANPSFPFGKPNFDRATYRLFGDEASALAALDKGDIDSILKPAGVRADLASHNAAGEHVVSNASSSAHFLVINPSKPALADPTFRRALFCAIDRGSLSQALPASALTSFMQPGDGDWSNPEAAVSCGVGYDPSTGFDPSKAVGILKSAGYTWATEPAGEQPGTGLAWPNGNAFPPVALLAPSEQADAQSAKAAQAVEASARYLGIPMTAELVSPADIRFAVFNSGGYDMALLGWRLSVYPGYLCDWFGNGNPFQYDNAQIQSACQALSSTSDLAAAHTQIFQIKSLLNENLPFIPIYSGLTYDVTRGLNYPFEHVLGGLSGLYGAPSLAAPASP